MGYYLPPWVCLLWERVTNQSTSGRVAGIKPYSSANQPASSQQQLYTRIDKSSSLKCKSIYQTRLFVVCHGRTVNGDWLGRGRINIMTTWIWCEPVCCWYYYYYFYLEANLEYDLISKLEKDVEEQIVLYKLDSSSSSLPPSSSLALCLTTNSAHSVVRWYHSRTGC